MSRLVAGACTDVDTLLTRTQVQHASGSVDTKGIIPWKHTGSGTKAADPHPEVGLAQWCCYNVLQHRSHSLRCAYNCS